MAILNVTNHKGIDGFTEFIVSDTGYNCASDPITTDYNTFLYHDGVGYLPALGDTIYKNYLGPVLFTNVDEPFNRNMKHDSDHLKVNQNGTMVATC